MKEEEDAAKEAFDATTFAQFLFGPSGRQTGAILLPLGVPGDDGHSTQGGMDPGDEAQPPIGSIQTDHARANLVETHRPRQEWTSEGRIMDVGGESRKKSGKPEPRQSKVWTR